MPKTFKRVVCLVADGFGVGELPDAKAYGDEGSNTLQHVAEATSLKLPHLEKLGIGNLGKFKGLASLTPKALVGRLAERSSGKDTTTGHWELAGLVTRKPFETFPKGFPKELVSQFVLEAKVPGVLGNIPASGTAIIEELGEEHIRTGKPILYTSADSVFQIACHEEAFGLEKLYQICKIARRLTEPYQIGRVIARPFIGSNKKTFKRTENRRDYAIEPGINCLDVLKKKGVEVISVGKIEDIFAHRGISAGNHTGNNHDSLKATLDFLEKARGKQSFIFTNLVDTDQLFGHRRDPKGYAGCLMEIDSFLPRLISEMKDDDLLILTSDHGCDPCFRGTDHTREYVPLIAYSPGLPGRIVGDRDSFSDVAASVLSAFSLSTNELPDLGKSFL